MFARRHLQRSSVAVLTAIATTLIGAGPLAATASTRGPMPSADPAPGLPNSASLTTPVIVEGKVRKSDGTPAVRQPVLLQAWPGPDVLRSMKPGDEIKLVTVGKAYTEADGDYQLRIGTDGMAAVRRYATASGLVDLELLTSDAAPFSFSRRVAGTELVQPDLPPGTQTAQARQPEHVNLAGGAAAAGRVVEPSAAATDAPEIAEVMEKSCTTRLVNWIGKRKVLVGQSYANVDGVPTKFSYTSGADSSLGVGVSMNGSYGSFRTGGTVTRESTASETFPTAYGAKRRYYDTWFRYGKYRTSCTSGIVGPVFPYSVRAAYWTGGTDVRDLSSSPSAHYCVSFRQGSTFTKDDSNAVTWSNGADLSGAIGIDLSTRTGYRTNARLHYTFNKTRALCGTQDYPARTPSRIVVRRASTA